MTILGPHLYRLARAYYLTHNFLSLTEEESVFSNTSCPKLRFVVNHLIHLLRFSLACKK